MWMSVLMGFTTVRTCAWIRPEATCARVTPGIQPVMTVFHAPVLTSVHSVCMTAPLKPRALTRSVASCARALQGTWTSAMVLFALRVLFLSAGRRRPGPSAPWPTSPEEIVGLSDPGETVVRS
eukprot:Rmarinus@m.4227